MITFTPQNTARKENKPHYEIRLLDNKSTKRFYKQRIQQKLKEHIFFTTF
jgi:hypothetical protein